MKTLDAEKFLSQFKDEGGTVTMSKMHEAIKAATVEIESIEPCRTRVPPRRHDFKFSEGSGPIQKKLKNGET